MTSSQFFGELPIDRFGKPMKELMIDFINHQNRRLLEPRQLVFGSPEPVGEMGEVRLPIRLAVETGWDSTETRYLKYKRFNIGDVLAPWDGSLVIHTNVLTTEAVVEQIFEQYGIYLDENTFDITGFDPLPEVLIASIPEDDGVPPETDPIDDGDDTPGDGGVDPVDPGDEGVDEGSSNDDLYLTLTFNNEHILFEGSCVIRVVPSIELLGTSISSILDIRSYFSDAGNDKFPVELFLKNFKMVVEGDYGKKVYIWVDAEGADEELLVDILRKLTGDAWVTADEPMPFNLHDCEILYNGLASVDHPHVDPAYGHVLSIKLSDVFCDNLSGVVNIGYRNNTLSTPPLVGSRKTIPVAMFKDRKGKRN